MITNTPKYMNKQLSNQLITEAQNLNIADKIYWEDGITNLAHLERMRDLNVSIPQSFFDYMEDDSTPVIIEPVSDEEKESVAIAMLNPKYDAKTNQLYYYDKDLDLNLSSQIFESGFGINSNSVAVNSWMRRFNGMSLTNRTAMPHPYGIVVQQLFCSVDSSAENAYFDCLHYDINGNNGAIVGRLLFNQQNFQMGFATENVKILIPEFRRVTIRSGGNTIRYPQGIYKYREVLSI